MAQIAAGTLGIPLARVKMIVSDTARMGDSGSASASRLTYMAGNAVKGAVEKALAAWGNEDRPAVGEYVYLAPKTTTIDKQTGYGQPNFAYGYVAQAAEVAVDTDTGEVTVERFISADDVGKAINPRLVVGQIEGAVVQALGYALMEDWKTDGGKVLTNRLSTYLIPTILDIPDAHGEPDRGGARSPRAVRRPRHGRDALSAGCGRGLRRGARRDRRPV